MPNPFVGEIRQFAFHLPGKPATWLPCDGSLLLIADYELLYQVIQTSFGGDGITTFGVPDLRGRVPVHMAPNYPLGQKGGNETLALDSSHLPRHTHTVHASSATSDVAVPTGTATWGVFVNEANPGQTAPGYAATADSTLAAEAIVTAGASSPVSMMQPYLALTFMIATFGIVPSTSGSAGAAAPYVGEIRAVAFSLIPAGWISCDGQTLPITGNQMLFSLLGTNFGGTGSTTFGIPSLGARALLGTCPAGDAPSPIGPPPAAPVCEPIGTLSGVVSEMLTMAQMPSHNHAVLGSTALGTSHLPAGNLWAEAHAGATSSFAYTAATPDVTMSPQALGTAGTSQPFPVLQPLQVIRYLLATTGLYPS